MQQANKNPISNMKILKQLKNNQNGFFYLQKDFIPFETSFHSMKLLRPFYMEAFLITLVNKRLSCLTSHPVQKI